MKVVESGTTAIEKTVEQTSKSLPYRAVTALPSNGFENGLYPDGASITQRPYTFGETQFLNSSNLEDKDIYKYVLNGVECSFDKLDLTIGDFLYIGWIRKLSTIGTTNVTATIWCAECNKSIDKVLDTMQLEFADIDVPEFPVTIDFPIKGESTELVFQPITLRKYFELADRKAHTDSIAVLASQVINHDYDEVYEAFYNSTGEDSSILQEIDKLLYHGVKPAEFFCENKRTEDDRTITCDNILKVDVEGGQALLRPFREPTEHVNGRIRFGTKASHKST